MKVKQLEDAADENEVDMFVAKLYLKTNTQQVKAKSEALSEPFLSPQEREKRPSSSGNQL